MEWSAYTTLAHATLAVGSTARKAAAAVWAGGHRGSTTPLLFFQTEADVVTASIKID
jgi:hypothetical protein